MKKVRVIESQMLTWGDADWVSYYCIILLWTRNANRKWSVPFPGRRMHANPTQGKQRLLHLRSHSPGSPASRCCFCLCPCVPSGPVKTPSYLDFIFKISPMQVLAYVIAKISSGLKRPWLSYILNSTDPRELCLPIVWLSDNIACHMELLEIGLVIGNKSPISKILLLFCFS